MCCTSGGPPQPQRNPAVFIPAARSGEVTFYLSLPSAAPALAEAAFNVSMPGSPHYRRFVSLDAAGRQFGATDAQIATAADAMKGLGLKFAVDPTRLLARVSGSIKRWNVALRAPLGQRAANAPQINCSAPLLQQRGVYAPQQIQTAAAPTRSWPWRH